MHITKVTYKHGYDYRYMLVQSDIAIIKKEEFTKLMEAAIQKARQEATGTLDIRISSEADKKGLLSVECFQVEDVDKLYSRLFPYLDSQFVAEIYENDLETGEAYSTEHGVMLRDKEEGVIGY